MSGENIAVFAANASTSLGLVADGLYDRSVARGLQQGRRFCELLQTGTQAAQEEHFSARTLAAGKVLTLAIQVPSGQALVDRAPDIETKLKTVQAALEASQPIRPELVAELKDYFFRFSASLPYYESIQRRLAGNAHSHRG